MSSGFNDTDFIFDLNEKVELVESGECGHVVGRAQFLSSDNTYLVRYAAADGRQVQEWWDEVAVQKHTDWKAEDVPGLTDLKPAWDQKQEQPLGDLAASSDGVSFC